MVPFGMKIELHGYDFLREKKIEGSSMGSNRFRVDMPRLLNQWKRGRLKLDHLISGNIKLDEIKGLPEAQGRHRAAPVDRFRDRRPLACKRARQLGDLHGQMQSTRRLRGRTLRVARIERRGEQDPP